MGECPFCGGTVPDETLVYGGSCPKCFGEIPGEEAATDPGEVVRAAQAKADDRRKAFRTLIPLLLAIPAVGLLAVLAIGFVWWNQDPVVDTMVFDDIEEFDYAIVSAPEPSEEKVEKVAKVTHRPKPGGPPSTVKPEVDAMGIPKVKVEKRSSGISFDGMGVTARRSGEVLTDPDQIRQMIGQKMRAYGRQLKLCYDKRLKVKEDLAGRWKATFTIGENGYASNITFRGKEMKDAEFEQCMVATVKKWRFAQISRPQPVEKNWRFRN